MPNPADTIVALASGPGRAPRALVRASGRHLRRDLAPAVDVPPGRGLFTARLRLAGPPVPALPALALAYVAPASYTGEDALELLLPGGPALVERVVSRLVTLEGVRAAEPGEFTARAYAAGRLTLEQAEGVAAAVAAAGADELAAARRLLDGRAGERYRAWSEEIAALLALVEAGVDFTDQEDVVPITPDDLARRLGALRSAMEDHAGSSRGEERADAMPGVVLLGAPSAGKSTLFNALLGRRRALTAPEPGTTRDALGETLDLSRDRPGAGAVRLIDLPGLGPAEAPDAPDATERAARARAADEIRHADVVVACDPAGRFELDAPGPPGRPLLRVRTKADLPDAPAPGEDPAARAPGVLRVCALDGRGLPALRRAIADAGRRSRAGAGLAGVAPRHARALARVRLALERAALAAAPVPGRGALRDAELVAQSLREALDALGDLAGRVTPDDVIGRIFASFCVGK